jgi:hypothetical protein
MGYCWHCGVWQLLDGGFCQGFYDTWHARAPDPSLAVIESDPPADTRVPDTDPPRPAATPPPGAVPGTEDSQRLS